MNNSNTFEYLFVENWSQKRKRVTLESFEDRYLETVKLVSQRLKEELSSKKNTVWFHMYETIYKDIDQPKNSNAEELKGYYQDQGYTVMLRGSNQCMPDMFYNGFWLKVKTKN